MKSPILPRPARLFATLALVCTSACAQQALAPTGGLAPVPAAQSTKAQGSLSAAAAQATASAAAATGATPQLKSSGNFARQSFEPGGGFYYSERDDAMQFAERIAARRNLPPEWVKDMIGQARFSASAQRLMRPGSSTFFKNWRVYRSRFVEPLRINAGVRFWRQHRDTLERAEKEFGVPQEILLGIIGVETIYGRDTGNYRVMDALATLAFDFPKTDKRDRSSFFQDELEQFLILQHREQSDPFSVRGSYAGAIGLGQFMPSSINKFAVDYDRDGHIDLMNSPVDAIGSVANYFKAFGWQTGKVAIFPIEFNHDKLDLDTLLAPDILPTFTAQTLAEKGVVLGPEGRAYKGPMALIELLNGDPDEAGNQRDYYAGTENFYVITRYNQSSYYAMAVLDLGAAIREKAGF